MKKQLPIATILLFLSVIVHAQCSDFIIYQSKGEVDIVEGSDVMAAKKNMKLTPDCRLSIGPESAVILLSGKDKALRLTSPGMHPMATIRATCMKNQSSLTKEYLNYVAQSILDKGEPKTAMVIKGAVYRTRTEFEATPMILPADSSVATNDPVTFAWHPGTPGVPKYLLIYENGVKEVFSKMVVDTTLTVDASLFKPETIYFWLISNSDTPSDKEPRFTFIAGESDWQYKFLDEQWEATMKELEGDLDSLQQRLKKQ
jgi:hypothetical protein